MSNLNNAENTGSQMILLGTRRRLKGQAIDITSFGGTSGKFETVDAFHN